MNKRMIGRIAGTICCVVAAAMAALCLEAAVPASVYAAEAGGALATTGSCGENDVRWSYADGVLTIQGDGAMSDYTMHWLVPWIAFEDEIKSIVIGDGITYVGKSAFGGLPNLTDVTIGDGVKQIGDGAFVAAVAGRRSPHITITMGNAVEEIGANAFKGYLHLDLVLPASVKSIGDNAFADTSYGAESANINSVEYQGTKEEWGAISLGAGNGYLSYMVTGVANGTCGPTLYYTYENEIMTISGEGEMTSMPWNDLGITPETVIIESGCTSICEYAFSRICENSGDMDTRIYVPLTVKSVGYQAFVGKTDGCTVYYEGTNSEWSEVELLPYENEAAGLYWTWDYQFALYEYEVIDKQIVKKTSSDSTGGDTDRPDYNFESLLPSFDYTYYGLEDDTVELYVVKALKEPLTGRATVYYLDDSGNKVIVASNIQLITIAVDEDGRTHTKIVIPRDKMVDGESYYIDIDTVSDIDTGKSDTDIDDTTGRVEDPDTPDADDESKNDGTGEDSKVDDTDSNDAEETPHKDRDNGEDRHGTKYLSWVTVSAGTATTDGYMEYVCSECGKVKYRVPISAYYNFNKESESSIKKAAQGATVKVDTELFVSFHKSIVDELKARPDVTLVVDYTYLGVDYEMTIPAGSGALMEQLFGQDQFAGFRYLAGAFATVER